MSTAAGSVWVCRLDVSCDMRDVFAGAPNHGTPEIHDSVCPWGWGLHLFGAQHAAVFSCSSAGQSVWFVPTLLLLLHGLCCSHEHPVRSQT
jgi:hypothetical protein